MHVRKIQKYPQNKRASLKKHIFTYKIHVHTGHARLEKYTCAYIPTHTHKIHDARLSEK